MAGSVNKCILIGNIGNDPEIKTMQSGDKIVNFSVATSESWKDKASGERKERTEWHRVVVFNQGLMNVCENYLKKGSKVYIEGQVETRNYENKDGQKVYTTEIVLRPYRGEITMLDSKNAGASSGGGYASGGQDNYGGGGGNKARNTAPIDELADEIPF